MTTMKLLAQFIPPLRDLALPLPKQVELKLIHRKAVEETRVFDRKMIPKWPRRLL
jgi:hypothetical protein